MYSYVSEEIRYFLKNNIEKDRHYVLYPNGEEAAEVKRQLLEDYDISPVFTIDNFHNNGNDILSLDEAVNRIGDDTKVLICSDRANIYFELRQALYNKIPKDKILDIFYIEIPTDDQMIEDMNEMDAEIRKYLVK